MSDQAEIDQYLLIGATRQFANTFAAALDLYGSRDVARAVTAEIAYIETNGQLPEWGAYIAAFEVVDGFTIFIHRERGVMQ